MSEEPRLIEADSDSIGNYCKYLDKEMTIMGLLTAFAVAVPGLVIDRVVSATENHTVLMALWSTKNLYLGVGSGSLLLSALLFYRQRSLLAFYYGQLRLSQTEARYPKLTAYRLLREVDSWWIWASYDTAFALLIMGFVVYGYALFAADSARCTPFAVVGWIGFCTLGYIALNAGVTSANRYADYPWRKLFGFPEPKKPNAGDGNG